MFTWEIFECVTSWSAHNLQIYKTLISDFIILVSQHEIALLSFKTKPLNIATNFFSHGSFLETFHLRFPFRSFFSSLLLYLLKISCCMLCFRILSSFVSCFVAHDEKKKDSKITFFLWTLNWWFGIFCMHSACTTACIRLEITTQKRSKGDENETGRDFSCLNICFKIVHSGMEGRGTMNIIWSFIYNLLYFVFGNFPFQHINTSSSDVSWWNHINSPKNHFSSLSLLSSVHQCCCCKFPKNSN